MHNLITRILRKARYLGSMQRLWEHKPRRIAVCGGGLSGPSIIAFLP